MKRALLFLHVLFNSLLGSAQDYRLFPSGSSHYFMTTGIGGYAFNGMNRYSQSPIKIARIDSTAATANGLLMYPFHTWRDTNAFTGNCNPKNGPSWMGNSVQEFISGTTWLLNADNDSIRIDHLANLGATWTMMPLRQGGRIDGTVDSLFTSTCIGITDSVKQIRLSVFDAAGNPNLSHPLQSVTLWLSKNNGLFKGLSFRDLPGYLRMDRMDSVPGLSYRQIYDFNTGDEFEFRRTYSNFGNTYPPSYFYIRVDNKWFSVNQDTVYYSLYEAGLNFNLNPSPSPHLDTLFTDLYDTVSYSDLSRILYGALPEENTQLELHPNAFGTYYMNKDSGYFHNRTVLGEVTGFIWDADSCITLNSFEPSFYTKEVAPGLGEILTIRDDIAQAGALYQSNLIWFNKGQETFGTWYNVFSGIQTPQESRDVLVYPNPATDACVISTSSQQFDTGEIYSMDGRMIHRFTLTGDNTFISIADYPSGLLTIRLNGTSTSTVVRIAHGR